MPVKNGEPYLTECLNSIIAQTYTNWELVICNDNSTDNTEAILNSYANKASNIKVVNNKGNGVIEALKTAYSLSVGNLISRMDADDIMPEQKLQQMQLTWEKHGKGNIVTALVKYFPKNHVKEGFVKYEQWLNNLSKTNTHWQALFKECVIASPCWLLHRDDFEACNGFNSPIYPEDYDLVFRFYEQNLNIVSVNEVLHLWRDHSERASRTSALYKEQTFFTLKLHYFFKWKLNKNKNLVLWGAGNKGKKLAKLLIENNYKFNWICNNPKKWGKHIYDVELNKLSNLQNIKNPCIIIAVSSPDAQVEILEYLKRLNLVNNEDYFVFC